MRLSQKHYKVFLSLLLLAVVSGCAVKPRPVAVNNTNEQVATSTNTNVNVATSTADLLDISDWKTYRNEEYGFEFKYPKADNGKEYKVYEFPEKSLHTNKNYFSVAVDAPASSGDFFFYINIDLDPRRSILSANKVFNLADGTTAGNEILFSDGNMVNYEFVISNERHFFDVSAGTCIESLVNHCSWSVDRKIIFTMFKTLKFN